ncbi:MAG: carboxypeptidase-like regulatory domain-containing protein [Bacteroidales bacterium]
MKHIIFFLLTFVVVSNSYGQNRYVPQVKGCIFLDGKAIEGATVILQNSSEKAKTNPNGYFRIELDNTPLLADQDIKLIIKLPNYEKSVSIPVDINTEGNVDPIHLSTFEYALIFKSNANEVINHEVDFTVYPPPDTIIYKKGMYHIINYYAVQKDVPQRIHLSITDTQFKNIDKDLLVYAGKPHDIFLEKKDSSAFTSTKTSELEKKTWGRSFIPSWSQFSNDRDVKGWLIVGGISATVGGALTLGIKEKNIRNKAIGYDGYDKKSLVNKAEKYETAKNWFLAGLAGIYVYNLVDGLLLERNRKKNEFTFFPTYDLQENSFALSLNIKF